MNKTCKIAAVLMVLMGGCINHQQRTHHVVTYFINKHVEEIKPLIKQQNLAYWEAATTGDETAYQQFQETEHDFLRKQLPRTDFNEAMSFYESQLTNLYGGQEDYLFLKKIRDAGVIKDTLLYRQVVALHNYYLNYQIKGKENRKILILDSEIREKYLNYTIDIDGEPYTMRSARNYMRKISDADSLRKIYLDMMSVGDSIKQDFVKIVKLRNNIAENLGYKNYYYMMLDRYEQKPAIIEKLLDSLEVITREPYREYINKTKQKLAKCYNVEVLELRPWHYWGNVPDDEKDFLPRNDSSDYLRITKSFFKSIDLPVDDILERGEVTFTENNKKHYSFFMNVDYQGDVRILVNTVNEYPSLFVMFHELGHALYEDNVSPSLPYLLRGTNYGMTEGIATYFHTMHTDPVWMLEQDLVSTKEFEAVQGRYLAWKKARMLKYARLYQVALRFERAIYENPNRDFDELWWELIEQYTYKDPPTDRSISGWANTRHFIIQSCYFQNYLIGELVAAQIHHHLISQVKDGEPIYQGNELIGQFLKDSIFVYGDSKNWQEVMQQATNEPLNAVYYFNQFQK